MKNLALAVLAFCALALTPAPGFSAVSAGTPWRTCMRYGGRDSTVFRINPATKYYLDIYSMTMARFQKDSVYFSAIDTSISHPWSAIIQFKWTSQSEATDIAGVLNDSTWAELPVRSKTVTIPDSTTSAGMGHHTVRDTAAFGFTGNADHSNVLAKTFPAVGDTTSVTMAVPGSGEIEVFFTRWNRHWVLSLDPAPQILPGALFVRVRPGGTNLLKFGYYFRLILNGVR
jgi:hypothetical protein